MVYSIKLKKSPVGGRDFSLIRWMNTYRLFDVVGASPEEAAFFDSNLVPVISVGRCQIFSRKGEVSSYEGLIGHFPRRLVGRDPTLTQGELAYGGGWIAGQRFGALEIVDAKPDKVCLPIGINI